MFILTQAVELYDYDTPQTKACDAEIERMSALTRPEWEAGELKPLSTRTRNSHSNNAPKKQEKIRAHLKRITLETVGGLMNLHKTVDTTERTSSRARKAGLEPDSIDEHLVAEVSHAGNVDELRALKSRDHTAWGKGAVGFMYFDCCSPS